MPTIAAKELIRKLRSHGIKVYLGPSGMATFSKEFSGVSGDLKIQVVQNGHAICGLLREEAARHARRAELNHQIKSIPTDEL